MDGRKVVGGGLIGLAMSTVAAASAVKIAGRRLRSRHGATATSGVSDAAPKVTHRSLATSDGGELAFVDVGEGDVVVLMHGVTLQWWVWSALIGVLATRSRVIAWDMRGHGESVAGSDGISMAAVADDLALLLESLDLVDAVVVGHSMGGMALGHFVERHPSVLAERVRGLVFLATSAAPLDVSTAAGSLSTMYGIAGRALVAGLRRPQLRYRWPDNDLSAVMLRTAFGKNVTAEMIDDVRRMSAAMSNRSMKQAGDAIATHDIRAALATVSTPTMVVVGDHDMITPPEHAREIAGIVPGAVLKVLPGVGHQVMQESPVALAAIIDRLFEA